ncbi:hypothetical protein [uncultured Devosia sp.]|uniref:hypothetical protein n=1 Tax=uncultured Devosia sp. TaxID=211434 RepID=UPI0035CB8BBF
MTAPTFPWPIARHFDADRLNRIANHPDVRPWVAGGTQPLDLAPVVANTANVVLLNTHGGCLFERVGPGVYEVHTLFEPDGRGEAAIEAVKSALHWMFTRTDCVELQTKVPDGNKGALGLVRAIHGTKQFHRANVWPAPTGMVGVGFYCLTISDWAGTCDETMEAGHWFHEKLEAAKVAAGAESPVHDDDDAHDRYVGATVEMMLNGQSDKALWFYNRWARFAGYALIQQIAANPLTIDIQDAVLAVLPNDFEVLLCR